MAQNRALAWRQGGYRLGEQVMFEGAFYYLCVEAINSVNLPDELIQGFWVKGGGDAGWSPIIAVVVDGERRVLRLQGWTGGTGTTPSIPINNYIGPLGLTTLAGATDVRGATGPAGATVASGVSYTPKAPLTGVNVQTALDQLADIRRPMAVPIGGYLTNALNGVAVATQLLTPNVLRCAAFLVTKPTTINELRINVTTAGSAGSRLWAGLYTNRSAVSGGEDEPGTLVATTGEQLSNATGVKIVAITPVVLTPGLYWTIYNCNEVGAEPAVRAPNQGSLPVLGVTNGLGANVQCVAKSISSTYSATAPVSAPTGWALTANASVPLIAMRRSA